MITFLKGYLVEKIPPALVIDVNGVGYELEASMQTFYQLPSQGQSLKLYTQQVIREDAHLLFGFYEQQERELFRVLIKTSGVGPRSAITILSTLNSDELINCVHQDDINQLVKVPGIGKKTAQRLLLDLQDQLKNWGGTSSVATEPSTNLASVSYDSKADDNDQKTNVRQDAINALITLGYKPHNATQAIDKAYRQSPDSSTEALIKQGLQQLN